jgi:hypothetical protein
MLLVYVTDDDELTGIMTSDECVNDEFDPGEDAPLLVQPEIIQKITTPDRHITEKNRPLRFILGILHLI